MNRKIDRRTATAREPGRAARSRQAVAGGRRVGASRGSDIDPEVLDALSRGDGESATLTEALAVDQYRLLQTVFPALWPR